MLFPAGKSILPHKPNVLTTLMFRSEDMTLYQLTVPKDDAWDVMNQLGGLDMAHFINLNKGEQPFNLPYARQVKRCEETERRIL